jgi:phospholipid/cholesterol/gamma-HCH transport system permease protein
VNALLALPWFVGHWFGRAVRATGVVALLSGRVVRELPRMRGVEYLRALQEFGVASLPLAGVVGGVIGAMVVLQTSLYTDRFGARAFLGWAAGHAVLWEFGPLLLGLMMAARVGARNAAELASLRIGGQIEGLSGVSVDPLAVLIAPRVWGMITAVSLLGLPTYLLAILSEAVAARLTLDLPLRVFLGSFAGMLGLPELLGGTVKTVAFACAVALVSTAIGVRAEGGARAVGQAAAASVVWSAAAIFSLDFILSALLARAAGGA